MSFTTDFGHIRGANDAEVFRIVMFFGRPFLSAGKSSLKAKPTAHVHRAFDLTFAQERINLKFPASNPC